MREMTTTQPFKGKTFEDLLNYLQGEVDLPNTVRKKVEEILQDPAYYYINGVLMNQYGIRGKGVDVVFTNYFDKEPEKESCLEHMSFVWFDNEAYVSSKRPVN